MPPHAGPQRGHIRQPCFFGEENYQPIFTAVRDARKEQCALHAYAFMTNHVLSADFTRRSDAVPRVIIALGRRYVQYINHHYRRIGTLWDSRYKSLFDPGRT